LPRSSLGIPARRPKQVNHQPVARDRRGDGMCVPAGPCRIAFSMMIGAELREQFRIPLDARQLLRVRHDQRLAPFLGHVDIGIGDAIEHGAKIGRYEAGAARAGLDLRDPKQRVERRADLLQFGFRLPSAGAQERPRPRRVPRIRG